MTRAWPARWARTALALAVVLLDSQASALDPSRSIRQYAHETWTTKEGLPEGAILSLAQTTDGYVWLGTQCCLVRYDGARFLAFEDRQLGVPQYSFVRDLVETPDGALWAALVGGLARYRRGVFDVFAEKDGLTHPFVYALAPGPGASLWVGTGGTGIWQFDPMSEAARRQERQGQVPSGVAAAFTPHPAYAAAAVLPAKINDLKVDGQGTLWAATDDGVLALGATDRAFRVDDGLPSLVANVVLVDTQQTVWVGTRRGLARTSAAQSWRVSVEDALATADVTALLEDRNHSLWIGTRDGGLGRLRGRELDNSASAGAESREGVFALTEDRAGSLWVGTGRGVERFRDGAFVTLGHAGGFPSDRILNVLARRSGGVWVLDGTGSVSILEGGHRLEVAPPGTIEGEGMLGLLESDDGSLWIGGTTLHRLRSGRWESVSRPGGDFTVLSAHASEMWVSQTSIDGTSTLSRFSGGVFEPVRTAAPLKHVQRLFWDRGGNLWISTGGLGLVRVVGGTTRVFRTADGLPHDVVYGLAEDDRGDLWVATRAGLARIRGDTVVSLASVPGTPHRSPVHVTADGLGFLWVTADDGIYRMSIASLDDVAERRSRRVVSQRFTTRDGLGSTEISWRCSAQTTASDGRMYYATARGLSVVDPHSAEARPQPPTSIAIDEIVAGGRRIDPSVGRGPRKDISIRDGRERIELHFSAPAFANAEAIDLRVRLVGYDADWIDVRGDRTVSYTNVPPGTYVFVVSAQTEGDAFAGTEASLSFRVEPRWYETAAARLLAGFAACLVLVAGYRLRVVALRRRELLLVWRVAERTRDLAREVRERRAAEEALQRLSDELDKRVKERTSRLESANVKLRRSEERYALAAEGSNDGLWDWDVTAGHVYFSPRWKAMLGYDPHEIGDDLDEWLSRVNPEDLGGLRRTLDACLAGLRTPFRHEYRMIGREGEEIWVACRGAGIVNSEGRVVRMAGSQADITTSKRAEADLYRNATHDALTGLPNRVLFTDRLRQAIVRRRRAEDAHFAVLFLDIDHFKTINDSFGHLTGDQLLIQIAERLRGCTRDVDTVARFGGDEFAILVADTPTDDNATALADRIQAVLSGPFDVGDRRVFASASIGIAISSDPCFFADDFLRDADTAMYRAKAQGRARYQRFDVHMREQAVERVTVEAGLRQALEKGELVLHYQPFVSLRTGTVVGAEALIRWQHPERGLLGPSAFLSIAEESGLIVPISAWVARAACDQAAAWQQAPPNPFRIHINVPPQLLSDPLLFEQIREHVRRSEISASSLGVELVESSLVEGRATVLNNLAELRAMGIHVSIDDFGTGYSSLSYLKRLPIDCLKIDRSFTQGVPRDGNDTAICTAIIAMARSLNLSVVAEGVETREQAEFMSRNGCLIAQGFYFSRPMSAADCTHFFASGCTLPSSWQATRAASRVEAADVTAAPPSLLATGSRPPA
ncbi:MAG: EAL domain-containing protein [Polyangiaceae bacterium]